MGLTSPDSIPYPEEDNAFAPLAPHFAAVAEGAQTAINNLRASASPPAGSVSGRNAIYPTPVQGNAVFRTDKGYEERFYAEYSAGGNPGGATPAGWYPTSGAKPAFYATASGISLASGTEIELTTGTPVVLEDSEAGFGTGTPGRYRFTPKTPGWWDFTLRIQFASSPTGFRFPSIKKNGSALPEDMLRVSALPYALGGGATVVAGSLFLSTTDYVSVHAWQDSGAAMSDVKFQWNGEFARPKRGTF